MASEASSIGDLKALSILRLGLGQALKQIKAVLKPLKQDLEMVVNQIKVHLVGRLVRPKNIKNLLYEVQDFDADSFSLTLRALWTKMAFYSAGKMNATGLLIKTSEETFFRSTMKLLARMRSTQLGPNACQKQK